MPSQDEVAWLLGFSKSVTSQAARESLSYILALQFESLGGNALFH